MNAAMTSATASPSVEPPERAGNQREQQPAEGDVVAAAQPEQRHARCGQPDPERVAPAAGLHESDGQRPQKLHGDADTERYGAQRQIEDDVHAGHREPEEQGREPSVARPSPGSRTQHRDEHCAGKTEAHQGDSHGAGLVEDGAGDGTAGLHRCDRDDHQHRCGQPVGR
jgi:hypothetical protein